MTRATANEKCVLMIAYTNYRTDPRVIRAAEAAASAGFKVDFIALRREGDPAEEFINGVRIVHLKQVRYRGSGLFWYMCSYLEFFLRSFFKATRLHFAKRYGVVHVNNMPDFFVFCALVPKLMGAKVILDIHDPMPNTFASKFRSGESGFFFRMLLWQEKLSVAFADQVLTVHEPVKTHILVNQHHLSPDAVEVVANFPDDSLFKLLQAKPPDGKLRLAYHGTILERNGLRNAMVALANMRHKDRVAVRIIGEGDFSDQLTELIKVHKLADIVQFDNRMYPLSQIPALLADCNLGLVPLQLSSITEYVLPLKLLEYLCLGMPSVTVRNSAIGYYFKEDECLFYKPDDPESLRAILDRLAEEPGLLAHYQRQALALRPKFLWSNEKQKYTDLLGKLTRSASR